MNAQEAIEYLRDEDKDKWRVSITIPSDRANEIADLIEILRDRVDDLNSQNATMFDFIRKTFCESHCEFQKDGCFKMCVVNKVLTASEEKGGRTDG